MLQTRKLDITQLKVIEHLLNKTCTLVNIGQVTFNLPCICLSYFFSCDGLFYSLKSICVITVLISNHLGSLPLLMNVFVMLLNGDCLYLP